MILKQIIYFSRNVVCICDGKCNKAWGRNQRPQKQLSEDIDDYGYLSDHELQEAPIDPGTYEYDQAKPIDKIMNKWCVRECERSTLVEDNKEFELPDFSIRIKNMSE